MKLTEILSCLPFYDGPTSVQDIDIQSIEVDHRDVSEGDMFICIKGHTVDGHDFAEGAIERGACAIISEKELDVSVPLFIVPDTSRALALVASTFYRHPTNDLSLIGVTGTNGKTTVTYLLEKIFKEYEQTTGLIGTIQMKIGDQSYPIQNTTPNALVLQRSFKQMKDENIDQAIMEVSSHALDEGRVFGCDFDVAIFTNLSQDHLDYHKDMDDYLRAKSLLFSQLGNRYGGERKFAILNADEAASDLLKRSTAQHVLTYGCEHPSDVAAKNIQLDMTHTRFTLLTPAGNVEITSQLIGMFNVYNMLAASAAAIALDVPLSIIKKALENISGVSGRFESVNAGQSFAVVVDYAHTPDSLENVLQTIKEFAERNIYVVVGCGGDRDRTKRPLMAQIAVKYASHAIFTSDNPRTEDPDAIIDDMVAGLSDQQENFEVITDRKRAITHAVNRANQDDIILVAGKGHETYQQIGEVTYDFDDREVAREAILLRGE